MPEVSREIEQVFERELRMQGGDASGSLLPSPSRNLLDSKPIRMQE